jgi:hypothetical protein
MTFSVSLFVISWICFFIFADKKKFHLFYPTCLFASYLACATDFLLTEHYVLWDYPEGTKMQTYSYHLMQQLGVYFVVSYLFLQNLPQRKHTFTLFRYVFYWTLLALLIEWLATTTGFMKYGKWWKLGWSYLCDWLLYFIFFFHHRWREKTYLVK